MRSRPRRCCSYCARHRGQALLAGGECAQPAKPPTQRRQRAQRFLKDTLARGAKRVTDVEEAAEKARVDPDALAQARAELGVVVSRGNAGGVQAVQWALPG